MRGFDGTASGILSMRHAAPAKEYAGPEGRQALERGMAIGGSKHDRRREGSGCSQAGMRLSGVGVKMGVASARLSASFMRRDASSGL